MQWSHYSQAIFDCYTTTQENILVRACPGSGKTTTITHLWTLDDKPTVYLVFGKDNQLEAESKMPHKANSHVLTLNSLGYRAIGATFGWPQLDERKVLNIIKKAIIYPFRGRDAAKKTNDAQWTLHQAVAKAKVTALDSHMSREDYEDMLSLHDLEAYDGMYEHVNKVLDISDDMADVIDFGDQIRIPALYRCDFPLYRNILCDEVQDFSPIQALLVSRLNPQGRYGFVGDDHQSIYGFRGAMNGSMATLADQFHCTELPLSISYRCCPQIVQEAAKIYPGIEPWEESPQGTVERQETTYDCGSPAVQSIGRFKGLHDGIVVCRFNRPLIEMAYTLLSHDIPCHVKGRDIGANLIRLVNSQQATSVGNLVTRLDSWYEEETNKARARHDERKQQSIDDKYTSLMLFIKKCGSHEPVTAVTERISTMFEQGRGVCLSTIHKAKGLEAQQCYILENQLYSVSVNRAAQPWQVEQEHNCQYVAVTRGKTSLVYM